MREIYENGECLSEELLWDYVSGKLPAQVDRAVKGHLERCLSCRSRAQEVKEDFERFTSLRDLSPEIIRRCWEVVFGEDFLIGSRLSSLKSELADKVNRESGTVWKASDNGRSNIIVGVLNRDGKVEGFTIFRFLLYPVINEHKISMALRERGESERYNGYVAHIVMKFNGLTWEMPAKVEGSEIVVEDILLPEPFPNEIEEMELDIFIEPPRGPVV
ncbi:TPA: zf-HC2 domain-containing protein [Candidatus Poribacteria bacterium]|nr:zf-HC2 domain-containing protein [Candidatus Poribacteria bacterium]